MKFSNIEESKKVRGKRVRKNAILLILIQPVFDASGHYDYLIAFLNKQRQKAFISIGQAIENFKPILAFVSLFYHDASRMKSEVMRKLGA